MLRFPSTHLAVDLVALLQYLRNHLVIGGGAKLVLQLLLGGGIQLALGALPVLRWCAGQSFSSLIPVLACSRARVVVAVRLV